MSIDANLKDTFVAALKEYNTSPGSGSGGNVASNMSGGGNAASMFWNGVKGLGGAVQSVTGEIMSFTGKLVRNNAQLPDVAGVFKSVANEFGGFGKLVGDGVGGIVGYMDDSVKNWQQFSDSGLLMNGSAMRLNMAMSLTRLNQDEYAESIKSLNGFTLNLGRTVSEGAYHYAEFSDAFQNSDSMKRLSQLGYTSKTANDLLAMYSRTRSDLDLRDANVRDKAILEVEKLGQKMAEVTAITGVSRQKQVDAIKEQQEDASFRARQVRAMREGDKDFLEKSSKLQEQFTAFSDNPFLMNAVKQSFGNGGQLEDDTRNLLSKTMPEFLQKLQDMGARFDRGSPEERARIIEEAKGLKGSYQQELVQGNASDFAGTRGILTSDEKNKLFGMYGVLNSLLANNYIETVGLRKNTPEQEKKAAAGLGLAGIAAEDDAITGIKAGQKEAGAETTKLVVNMQRRLKDLSTVSNEFISKLNTEIGLGVDGIRAFNLQPILNNGGIFKAIIERKLDTAKFQNMDPEDAKNYIMNLLEGAMQEVSSKKAANAEKKAGAGLFGPGFKIVGELGPELVKMQNPGDMLTALDTKTMASDLSHGMGTILPMLSMLKDVPQTLSSVMDASTSAPVPDIKIGQEDATEVLKQISTKMEQFVSVAMQIANHTDKTARNTNDLGDNVYS